MNKLKKLITKTFREILSKIATSKSEMYIFWITIGFYFLLWFINPNNKLIVSGFIFLIFLYYFKFKKIKKSIFFTYIASAIIFTGKTYHIQLLPPGILSQEIFPQGYFVNLVISPSHVLSFIMFLILVREFFVKQKRKTLIKPKITDFLLVIFFLWKIFSNIMSSKIPTLSLLFTCLSLSNLIFYFYIRLILKAEKKLWPELVSILCAMIIVESLVSYFQFTAKSPLYKNIESQVSIEYFGKAVDEMEFTFRPVGTFNHANSLGIWLSSTLVFLIVFLLDNLTSLLTVSFLMGFISLIMTLSRSSWLSFFLGSMFLAYSLRDTSIFKKINKNIRKINILLLVPISIWLTIFFIIPRVEKTFYSFGPDTGGGYFRKIQIEDALEIIKVNPLLGIGNLMAVYEGISLDLHTISTSIPLEVHNWFLQLCLSYGMPSLVFFISFVFVSIRSYIYNSKKQKNRRLYLGIASSIISLFVAGLFQPYINEHFILLLLGTLNSDIIGNNYDKNY